MQFALLRGSDPRSAHRGAAEFSVFPMLLQIGMPLVIPLIIASGPGALAHDAAWSRAVTRTRASVVDQPLQQTHGLEVSRTAWPAPTGHRQPRAEDIPAEGPKKSEFDVQLERLDRALDGKLRICRGC